MGFRLDAAKRKFVSFHVVRATYLTSMLSDIPAVDIANITGRLTNHSVYITQEVIYGGPQEAIQPSQYTSNGDVME